MNVEKIPFFAIAGLMLLLSMFLYTTANANFTNVILPTYLTQALVYIALGYAVMRGHGKAGFTIFLMSLLWLFNQILWWGNSTFVMPTNPYLPMVTWGTFLGQGLLAVMFFRGKNLKYVPNASSPGWPYASYWVLMLYGFAKLVLVWSNPLFQMSMWSVSILLISFGYVVHGAGKKQFALAFIVIGVLLAAASALTINTSGLSLMP
jgi:hypothetical protein